MAENFGLVGFVAVVWIEAEMLNTKTWIPLAAIRLPVAATAASSGRGSPFH